MKWKIFIILLSLCGCAYCEEKSGYNGQPGCKTTEEMMVKYYRNFWDPTAYWECIFIGSPGVARRCYDGYAFQTSRGRCIKWFEWRWEEEELPPSFPWNVMNPADQTAAMKVEPLKIQVPHP